MRFSHFCIDRPIFATVLAILIVLVGGISWQSLPVSQYPEIAPPSISVTANYPGASAETVANTVASVIEEQINGVEHMLYIKSENTADGSTSITVTFEPGTDLDIAQVQVQNRVALAEPELPEEVQRQGVSVIKNSPDIMMVIHILSPDGSRDSLYVSNYASSQVLDQLVRIEGVGQARLFAERAYAMRVWIDPQRAAILGLTANDIVNAISQNNAQVAAGVLDKQPTPDQGAFELTVETQGRLITPEQFSDIIVKQSSDGVVRLRDVARVELAAQDYSLIGYLDGKTALPIGIFQRPDSNAVETAAEIEALMEEISKTMPEGIDYEIVYNPTEFISESIDEIYKTIIEATILVVIVILVFLQTWRAAIIPVIAIPVSLIGTCALLALFGFSLNNLSLFGLVLAIGIVVDDAIVVVENIEHYIHEGLTPRDAAHRTMDEVGGALVAIAIVLTAVFLPTLFITGISGAFYKQFALTIASATILSLVMSLSLSPALAALLLKPKGEKPSGISGALGAPFRAFGRGFNKVFDATARGYGSLTRKLVRIVAIMLVVYAGLMVLAFHQFSSTPTGFIPQQDKGYLIAIVQLPAGASLSRTDAVMRQAEEILTKLPGVAHTVPIVGLDGSTFTIASNSGIIFLPLKPYEERLPDGLTANVIMGQAQGALSAEIREAMVFVVSPPPVNGIGNAGGWKLYVQDLEGRGQAALAEATRAFIQAANGNPELTQVYNLYQANTPRIHATVDRTRAELLGVNASDINSALSIYLGSRYVNDFNFIGQTYRVIAQAEGVDRNNPDDILRLKVRSATGEMVPLGSLITLENTVGPIRLSRYNVYPAIDVQGQAAPGISSGQSLAAVEQLMEQVLPDGFGFEWTDMALQEKLAGNTAIIAFALAVVFVFLLLAALYESWLLPLSVILIVPMCLLAAIVGVDIRGIDNNILVQIGLVVLIGLASKNAILIVEFARQNEHEGQERKEAAADAAQRRLRPILMTSFAFILGVVPLVIATGAGAEMRQDLGTAVFAGMIGVTVFGLVFTPIFYVFTRWIGHFWEDRHRPHAAPAAEDELPPPAAT